MKKCIFLLFFAIADCSLDRCHVLQAVKASGLVGIKGYTAGDYVCLAYHASGYDPTLNRNPYEYGMFQINSYMWCDDGKTRGRKNLCHLWCKDLLDNYLSNDLRCVEWIVHGSNGLDSWDTWRTHCKGRDLRSFETGC
ncbi:hypothetical protein GDO81_013261 [Engystomops pustulosus]|uniref:Lysozyme n=1 Tax=Engystomops pustulosus TaxID=76066 RepID=A0AAV7B2A7_ENGPU|nr:hypothetical protein GDO81_013261 [Engystomops pustulosus]